MAIIGMGTWQRPLLETLRACSDCSGRYRGNDFGVRMDDTCVVAAQGIHSVTMTDVAHLDGWLITTRKRAKSTISGRLLEIARLIELVVERL